jgi:hypothetical protein
MSETDAPLTQFVKGIWLSTAPVRILGMKLTATMAVLRLADSSLLLYSPLAMTPERRAAVDALGPVAHLYAPNLYHHLYIGEWAAAYPSARVHGAADLSGKRPDLRIDRVHGSAPEPAFADCIDELPIAGFRLQESVLIYRPAQTLLVADLVHNVGRPQHRWTVAYTKMMGFYDQVAISRMIRWAAFFDRAAARRSLDEVLARPFERLVVGHGDPLESGAHEAIAAAYAWLPCTR